ncbi:MAG TPA: hypothetical protein VMR18_00965 [Candidatus Saccharimonadales bacterium]|nr:hypothetical protein [Candidatus Saccharimonadales bacterium]
MSKGWSLTTGSRIQVNLDLQSVGVLGKVSPRLLLVMHAETPNERTQVEFHDVRARVTYENELLGETRVAGVRIDSHGTSVSLEVPTSHRMLSFVVDRLGPNTAVALNIEWDGILKVLWEPNETDVRFQGEIEPGDWREVGIDGPNHKQYVAIPRSDWYVHVVGQLGLTDILFSEIAVPKGPLGDQWRAANALLQKAEQAYTVGDDPAVFLHLRGAFDALPGAKKAIYDGLPEPQRKYVDDLAKALATFLHAGRHVGELAAGQAGFPVDHVDARFAMNLLRVLLSYTSSALAAAQLRVTP